MKEKKEEEKNSVSFSYKIDQKYTRKEDESEEEVDNPKRRFLLLKPSKLIPLCERKRSVALVSKAVYSSNISVIIATIIMILA